MTRLSEQPQHEVPVPAYYIARYPVTINQFRAFVEDSGVKPKSPDCLWGISNHPVVNVTWGEAAAYAKWMGEKLLSSEKTPELIARLLRKGDKDGQPWVVVLPSEAEWEKAARGADGRIYPWGDNADPERANYRDTWIKETSPVGSFPGGVSLYGCEEMSGNVWEWTRSIWRDYPYSPSGEREYMDVSGMSCRVARGGSFYFSNKYTRAAVRDDNTFTPAGTYRGVGLRVVISPFPSEL